MMSPSVYPHPSPLIIYLVLLWHRLGKTRKCKEDTYFTDIYVLITDYVQLVEERHVDMSQ